MTVEAAELPPRPAAVEVAAYRITVETLLIEVTDDGCGDEANRQWTPASGTESMRERADQLGGTFSAGPTPRGGQVQARLPIPAH